MGRPSNRQRTMKVKEATTNSSLRNSNIVWSGEPRTSYGVKHYPAFLTLGIHIAVNSFVYVMGEENNEYLAYVEDLYENRNGVKLVKVRWFTDPKDVSKDLLVGVPTHDREVLMSPNHQEIMAECINGVASILNPAHFEKCLRFLPYTTASEVFLCHREITDGKIMPFPLSNLQGYSKQAIIVQTLNSFEVSDVPEPQSYFKVNDNVELLSQDSGMRGCWFRCKILSVTPKRLKVMYYDVFDVDEPSKLVEWVSSPRVASPDELETRVAGRLTVRPWPSQYTLSPTEFEAGSAVDAWWCNAWWEGVMIGYQTSELDTLQVYFPGEKKFLTVARENIRVSRDWIDCEWVDIKPKRDILSHFAILNPMSKLQAFPDHAGKGNSTHAKHNNHNTPIPLRPKDRLPGTSKPDEPSTSKLAKPGTSRTTKPKDGEKLSLKKRLTNMYREDLAGRK